MLFLETYLSLSINQPLNLLTTHFHKQAHSQKLILQGVSSIAGNRVVVLSEEGHIPGVSSSWSARTSLLFIVNRELTAFYALGCDVPHCSRK